MQMHSWIIVWIYRWVLSFVSTKVGVGKSQEHEELMLLYCAKNNWQVGWVEVMGKQGCREQVRAPVGNNWGAMSPSKGRSPVQSQVSRGYLDGEGWGQENRRDWVAAERGNCAGQWSTQEKKERRSAASRVWRKRYVMHACTASKFVRTAWAPVLKPKWVPCPWVGWGGAEPCLGRSLHWCVT